MMRVRAAAQSMDGQRRAALDGLPQWDLSDLYPGRDSPALARDLTQLAGDALGPLLAGWLINDIPRSAFDPIAAVIRSVSGRRPNGGDSAEAIRVTMSNSRLRELLHFADDCAVGNAHRPVFPKNSEKSVASLLFPA